MQPFYARNFLSRRTAAEFIVGNDGLAAKLCAKAVHSAGMGHLTRVPLEDQLTLVKAGTLLRKTLCEAP